MPKIKTMPTRAERENAQCVNVWANIEYYKTIHGLEYEQLASIMHVGISTVYNRKCNPNALRMEEVVRLANYFKVDISNLTSIR
jgi:hypothetical protein